MHSLSRSESNLLKGVHIVLQGDLVLGAAFEVIENNTRQTTLRNRRRSLMLMIRGELKRDNQKLSFVGTQCWEEESPR